MKVLIFLRIQPTQTQTKKSTWTSGFSGNFFRDYGIRVLQYFTCCYFNDVILKYRFGVGIEGLDLVWFGFEQILVFSIKLCNYGNNSQHF